MQGLPGFNQKYRQVNQPQNKQSQQTQGSTGKAIKRSNIKLYKDYAL